MLKISKLAVVGISVVALGCSGFVLYVVWRGMKEDGYMSCISSLTDTILNQNAAAAIQARNNDWKILDDAEFDLVMEGVKGTDCAGIDDPRLDLQQHKIHIALRKKVDGRWPPIIVWSDGSDGIPNSADDIIMPYGQKIPR